MSLSKKTLLEALIGFKIQFKYSSDGVGIKITPSWKKFGNHEYEYFVIDEVGDDIFLVKEYTGDGVLSGSKYMSIHHIVEFAGTLFK